MNRLEHLPQWEMQPVRAVIETTPGDSTADVRHHDGLARFNPKYNKPDPHAWNAISV